MASRADLIYQYKLYSIRRLPKFIKYSKARAKSICEMGERKSLYLTLLDMMWCNLAYGTINSEEYLLFRFFEKSHKERKKYFTRRKYYKMIKTFDYDTFARLSEKQNQYIEYADFIKRKWMVADKGTTKSELFQFVESLKITIFKPVSSDRGSGVEKIRNGESDKIEQLFHSTQMGVYLLEECLENCSELKNLNPSSLNTLRITYILRKDGTPHIFNALFRIGTTKDSVVDNWGAGGIMANVDLVSGKINSPGYDEKGNVFFRHPLSGIELIGFQIPRFKEALEFSKAVASVNKKVVFGGLDLAITEKGVELVEINFPPANVGYQVFGKGYLEDVMKINR